MFSANNANLAVLLENGEQKKDNVEDLSYQCFITITLSVSKNKRSQGRLALSEITVTSETITYVRTNRQKYLLRLFAN